MRRMGIMIIFAAENDLTQMILCLTQKYRIPPNKFALFLCLLINKIRFPYEWSPALDNSEHSK